MLSGSVEDQNPYAAGCLVKYQINSDAHILVVKAQVKEVPLSGTIINQM